ncbi:MAG: ATP-binding protein [Butyrivibrio sp.]|nr:ATP-binding protein [Acetatifactor muris]MCM1559401.1 ATP-binding protein [Butyrivibrio sp.]
MNIKEKVQNLVKYCGSYEGHSFMMDERNMDSFNITLPEEAEVREKLSEVKFILLTGEAGDGKTRLLRNLAEPLKKNDFEVCMDFSEINDAKKDELIDAINRILGGENGKKYIIAANIGIFTKIVLRMHPELLKKIRSGREDVHIINFERRNLAADKILFQNIVSAFLSFDRECECEDVSCPFKGDCVYRKNIIAMLDKGMEGLRVLCDAVYLTGGHITFRELLSLLSYMVTFGQDCESCKAAGRQTIPHYYQIFAVTTNFQLKKFYSMDPAKKRSRNTGMQYSSREDCMAEKRRLFFESEIDADERYELLYVDYIKEYRAVLDIINGREPYFFSTMDSEDENLVKLKLGLSKITRAGNTNLKMTVADTPSIFDGSIQTEFDIDSSMETIWKRYDLDLQHRGKEELSAGTENCFYLSYVYPGETESKLQEIKMLINYPLFRFLMFSADDYHTDRNGVSIQEYTVNTFYRKVLRSMPETYRKAHIRFDEKKKKRFTNFNLELIEQNSMLFGNRSMVMIEKESEA